MLKRVQEEDNSYGKGSSFDLSSRFSSPAISRNRFDDVENPRKATSFKLPSSRLKLCGFQEEEETESTLPSFVYRIGHEDKIRCPGCFSKCCAWTWLFLFIVLIVILLTGFSMNFSIKSKLPEVSVTNLKLSRIDISKSSPNFLMNENMNTVLEFFNKNEKTMLSYSPVKADVSSENINLRKKTLTGFKQGQGNITSLKIPIRLRKSKVYDVDATMLRNIEKRLEAVISVFLKGKLSFGWLGFRLHLPIVIACQDVIQSDVINGLKRRCDVRSFST